MSQKLNRLQPRLINLAPAQLAQKYPVPLSLEQISHIILALDHSNHTLDCEDVDLQNGIIAKLAVALATSFL